MKKALMLPLLLMCAAPMTGQVEHAPTPEQCRADANVWSIPKWGALNQNENEFARATSVMVRDHSVTARALDARIVELGQCVKTDSTQAGRYIEGDRAYATAKLSRMANYLLRHNLTEQFYQEDEQGQR